MGCGMSDNAVINGTGIILGVFCAVALSAEAGPVGAIVGFVGGWAGVWLGLWLLGVTITILGIVIALVINIAIIVNRVDWVVKIIDSL